MQPLSTRRSFVVGLLSFACLGLLALPLFADHHAEQLGEAVGEGELTAISKILADPEGWEGREVRVAGEVTEVCTIAGCWMEIEDDGGDRMRVKVDDGVIVFPASARGHRAVARGTVERIELDRERYEGWMRHLADEQGREFDPASIGDGPYEIVRIRGVGAEIDGDAMSGDAVPDEAAAEGGEVGSGR